MTSQTWLALRAVAAAEASLLLPASAWHQPFWSPLLFTCERKRFRQERWMTPAAAFPVGSGCPSTRWWFSRLSFLLWPKTLLWQWGQRMGRMDGSRGCFGWEKSDLATGVLSLWGISTLLGLELQGPGQPLFYLLSNRSGQL